MRTGSGSSLPASIVDALAPPLTGAQLNCSITIIVNSFMIANPFLHLFSQLFRFEEQAVMLVIIIHDQQLVKGQLPRLSQTSPTIHSLNDKYWCIISINFYVLPLLCQGLEASFQIVDLKHNFRLPGAIKDSFGQFLSIFYIIICLSKANEGLGNFLSFFYLSFIL